MLCELKIRCRKCGVDHRLSELPLDKSGRYGVSPRCRMCRCAKMFVHRRSVKSLKVPPTGEKRCRDCGEVRPCCEFYRNTGSKDGLVSHCKRCASKRRASQKPKRAAVLRLATPDYARCRQCEQILPSEAFSVDAKRHNGLNLYCRSCTSIRLSARTYSISLEAAKELRSRTECECCGVAISGSDVNIDHCHATGAVRGTLCSKCNFMLGAARDRPDILRAGAAYLESRMPATAAM